MFDIDIYSLPIVKMTYSNGSVRYFAFGGKQIAHIHLTSSSQDEAIRDHVVQTFNSCVSQMMTPRDPFVIYRDGAFLLPEYEQLVSYGGGKHISLILREMVGAPFMWSYLELEEKYSGEGPVTGKDEVVLMEWMEERKDGGAWGT